MYLSLLHKNNLNTTAYATFENFLIMGKYVFYNLPGEKYNMNTDVSRREILYI